MYHLTQGCQKKQGATYLRRCAVISVWSISWRLSFISFISSLRIHVRTHFVVVKIILYNELFLVEYFVYYKWDILFWHAQFFFLIWLIWTASHHKDKCYNHSLKIATYVYFCNKVYAIHEVRVKHQERLSIPKQNHFMGHTTLTWTKLIHINKNFKCLLFAHL